MKWLYRIANIGGVDIRLHIGFVLGAGYVLWQAQPLSAVKLLGISVERNSEPHFTRMSSEVCCPWVGQEREVAV
jgi:hypothetical protein